MDFFWIQTKNHEKSKIFSWIMIFFKSTRRSKKKLRDLRYESDLFTMTSRRIIVDKMSDKSRLSISLLFYFNYFLLFFSLINLLFFFNKFKLIKKYKEYFKRVKKNIWRKQQQQQENKINWVLSFNLILYYILYNNLVTFYFSLK